MSTQLKLIAFYLPQFHPIAENDEWWGPGFTEWRNVVQARPMFKGHHQPHLPAELGFYDLRVSETRQAQADMAREYGIYGFCYYYYWFNGRKLLQRPLEDVVESGTPDFPFCICWANENWTRTWDGLEKEILVAQEHTTESDEAFFRDVLPILQDPRYIKVGGKPLLMVYRVNLLADPKATASRWRELASSAGLPGLELCAVQSFGIEDPRLFGFDASVEFPPHGYFRNAIGRSGIELTDPSFDGFLYDYRRVVSSALIKPTPDYPQYRGVMPGWDNSARRRTAAHIYHHNSPELYGRWLREVCEQAYVAQTPEPIVFINAWNEWAEGAHLEPDLRTGRAYLEATREAASTAVRSATIAEGSIGIQVSSNRKLVSVVIPSYNHAKFIATAIRSVASQDYPHVELIIIDDGSRDNSLEVIEQAIERYPVQKVTIRSQSNLGAAAAIDRGVMLSEGEYVAILNSDDFYLPGRVRRLVEETHGGRHAFCFSGVEFCDQNDQPLDGTPLTHLTHWYRRALADASNCPTAGYALLCSSITVTTSNFFFTRELFDAIGGFNNKLALCHDWDFALAALQHTEPVFVGTALLAYRYHGNNTILAGTRSLSEREGMAVLAKFSHSLNEAPANGLAPHPLNWGSFFSRFLQSHSSWFSQEPLARFIETPSVKPAVLTAPTGCGPTSMPSAGVDDVDLQQLFQECERVWSRSRVIPQTVIELT